jgi:hypothetical protein
MNLSKSVNRNLTPFFSFFFFIREVREGSHQVRTHDRGVSTRQRYGPGDEWRLRVAQVILHKEDGNWVRARLLREATWLDARGAVVGGVLALEMPEMGVVGWARVEAVEACPRLPEAQKGYRLVTATFEHSSGVVVEVTIAGESKPLVVTPQHPVWCEGRQAYVPVGELEVGERLLAEDGTTPEVLGISLRELPERVYTLEVEGDHCFRVGEQGVLGHNQSTGQQSPGGSSTPNAPCSLAQQGCQTPDDLVAIQNALAARSRTFNTSKALACTTEDGKVTISGSVPETRALGSCR